MCTKHTFNRKQDVVHYLHKTFMMSDLAPFVAAAIRDSVFAELKDENEALRQENEALKLELHECNPMRSVKVTCSNGQKIFVDNELNLEHIRNFHGNKFSFCNLDGLRRRNILASLSFIYRLELWIDGGSSAVRLQDLSFHYTEYKYEYHTGAWKYVATLEARDGDDLNLEIQIFLSPDVHAKLLHREQSVAFIAPTERGNDQYLVEHLDQEIPISHLLELCGEAEAVFSLNNWKCTEAWFLRHLMVPYVPQRGRGSNHVTKYIGGSGRWANN
jgi:hypothetical protein